jgi:NTP pyrophosphatase (non-canonical NTP hydrolase)
MPQSRKVILACGNRKQEGRVYGDYMARLKEAGVDRSTSIQELKQKAVAFRDDRNWRQFHDPKNLAIGMAIECAELEELFLWKNLEEIDQLLHSPAGKESVSQELADVFIFLLYLADACQVDLSEAVCRKLEVNEQKYPIAKSHSQHKKYTEL